ncbi:MAG: PIN domain-containing protein [Planctomycetales bacterium]|nr:PIN domain-containing protein [Planctomycetales bacterium]
MSYALDVNILVCATNGGDPRNPKAIRFLESCLAGGDVLCFTWPVLMSFVRIVTDTRILAAPLSPREALTNVERFLTPAHARVLLEGEGFLEAYRETTAAFPVRGKLVPDAHLAVTLKQHGVRTLYSADTDFRKFPFLDVRNPLV